MKGKEFSKLQRILFNSKCQINSIGGELVLVSLPYFKLQQTVSKFQCFTKSLTLHQQIFVALFWNPR